MYNITMDKQEVTNIMSRSMKSYNDITSFELLGMLR